MFWPDGTSLAVHGENTRRGSQRESRYYSNAILGCIHRARAIKEWVNMMHGKDVSLERALGAFDMFVLHGKKGDFEDVSR